MKSSDDPDLLDLERDVPTTPEDLAALKRARELASRVNFDACLRFLAALGPAPPAALRSRKGPRGNEFFEL
jgi:hypothetical protein